MSDCKKIHKPGDCKSRKDCFWGKMGRNKPACYAKKPKKTSSPPQNPEYLMILDDAKTSKRLFEDNEFFQNPQKYNSEVKLIGTPSVHGMIFKVSYNNIPLIMKVSRESNSDSLLYEYLAGLCLSHFSFTFPIFSKTVSLLKLSNRLLYSLNSRTKSIDFNKDVNFINPTDLDSVISDACENNESYSLITQYLPIKYALHDYIEKCISSELNYYNLFSHLIFLYSCLVGMSDVFTHYDLHTNNVVLVDLDGKYLDVIIHLANGKDCSIKMLYLPTIIDYGSVYVNCGMVDTREIMKKVCKSSECQPDCGKDYGYNFVPEYDEHTDEFGESNDNNYYFDRTRTNVSHDLKILNIIQKMSIRSGVINKFKNEILNNVIYQGYYGTPEIKTRRANNRSPIVNIFDANDALVEYSKSTDYVEGIERFIDGKEKYGTLEIWQDRSKPFKLSRS